LINGIKKKQEYQWSQEIVEYYFDIFVCRHSQVSKIILLLQKSAKIILGIDPGTLLMGYGLIEVDNGHARLLEMNVLKLSSRMDAYERLQLIHRKVNQLIEVFSPNEFAIEAPFFGKNVQSMLKLGRAQGVAIATAMQAGIPVTEYSPKKIKQSITGNGNAGKEQVWKMLQHLLQLRTQIIHYDASDALAVAMCHHFQFTSLKYGGKKMKGWGEFVSKNPARVNRQ
jgi:crossover junction endodeoxyribonuclease RuvC